MIDDFFVGLRVDILVSLIKILVAASPIWLPILLFAIFLTIWLKYVRTNAIMKDGGVLLEIKLPRDVFKSPLAMEVILTSLYQSGKSTYLETFLKGKHRPWFTFEIASIEGQIRFFIWSKAKYRQLIESQFYAQYPGVEIHETEDYSKDVFVDPQNTSMVGLHFKLTKDDIYPIKTYVDYGLDKSQEEEEKIDPMTSSLEFLSSIKAGEQVWIQILFQAHTKMNLASDAIFPTRPDWKKAAQKKIKEYIDEISSVDDDEKGRRAPTPGEKDTISAMERSLSKFPFDVAIRTFYVARKESFDSITITGMLGSFRQYNSESLNGFKISKGTGFDYPWQDFRQHRQREREISLLNAYKLRSFFQIPYKHIFAKPFILTTEELATIFHLPGRVLGTPTISKVASKKSEAPSNLPI